MSTASGTASSAESLPGGHVALATPRRALVTGAAGMLGSDVVPALARAGIQVVPRALEDLDVTDSAAVRRAFREAAPDVVVNCAAFTRVDDCETDPRAHAVNAAAVEILAEECLARSIQLVHVSTDFVFDGRRERGGYSEDDAAVPITDYGRAKLAGERAVADAAPDALIVRTSLIYGGDRPGPHELMVLDALDGRRDVAFFSDELRCPILAAELAAALLELARRPLSGTLHVAGADTVSRLEFARLVALSHGRDPASLQSALSAAARPRRPLNCVLDCSRAAGLLKAPVRGVRAVLGAGVPPAGQSLD